MRDGLLDDAALAVGDEVDEVEDVLGLGCAGDGDEGLADGGEGVGGVELRGLEETVGFAEVSDLCGCEAAALEAYLVDTVGVVGAFG